MNFRAFQLQIDGPFCLRELGRYRILDPPNGEDIKIIFFRKLVNIRLEVVKFKRKLILLYY